MRWASDHSGPPHPAAIAEMFFAETVEKKIPGSKVQIYWAKSLYNVPQGMKALKQGNLEMMTGQFGKTSSVEPLANTIVGAGKLTTPGAINGLLVTRLRLPPFIVTLGTWNIFFALVIFFTGSQSIRSSDIEINAPLLHFWGERINLGGFVFTYGAFLMIAIFVFLWF